MSQSEIIKILTKYKTIAVVGLSRTSEKPSYIVSDYMKRHGFHIIPVNPYADEILGEKSYRSLMDIPPKIQKTIEVVDVFRPPKDVPEIVDQVIKLKTTNGKPNVVWMQLGVVNQQAADAAKKAGLTVVMDKCIMREHERLL
jgi:predicted CoA-binding protein